jgi:hypothetical protein
MNFDEAIKAHTYWKVMLKWLINGQRPLDANIVSLDSVCELGKWIAADGQAYSGLAGFDAFVRLHAAFHEAAGAVARLVESGHRAQADAMMAPQGEFTLASENTIAAIKNLKLQVENNQISATAVRKP